MTVLYAVVVDHISRSFFFDRVIAAVIDIILLFRSFVSLKNHHIDGVNLARVKVAK